MAIRYNKKLKSTISRIVRNYNAKVRRLSGRVDLDIPPLMDRNSVKLLKETTRNRADLNRKLKNLQEFTKRGGEQFIKVKGREIPRYKYKQIQRYRSLINRRLTAREKFNESTYPTYEGIKEKFTIAQQFDEEVRNIQAKREKLIDVDYLDYSASELSKYITDLESNAKTVNLTQWQQNYADILLDVGYVHGIEHAKLHELREKLLDLSPAQFDKLFKTESTIKQLIYYYKEINQLGVDIPYTDKEHEDVLSVYDSLFNNINTIIKDYQ